MVEVLTKIFIKDSEDVKNTKVRALYGTICGIVGICLNIILFIVKYIAGILSSSIAITADAFNNLSDAASSLVMLIGFKMSNRKADASHPFGHGRIEYISGFIVSIAILLMGIELLKSSIQKIFNSGDIDSSMISIAILVLSILIKIYMYLYNKKIGTKISSSAMKATALDSLSDSVATLVVLISILVNKFASVNIDGISGILVSIFILYSGYSAAKDTIDPLIGNVPDADVINEIKEIVSKYKQISGMHDLIIHDYGPGRMVISFHAEVPGNKNIYELHDCIDNVEGEISDKIGCETVIHMDPIEVNNSKVMQMRGNVSKLIKTYNDKLSIHDFRMVEGPTHTNLIFDVVVPLEVKTSYEEIERVIKKTISLKWPRYNAVIKVEKSYIN